MSHGPLSFSSLIGSRICHDLISPIGAISNGLELLELSGAAQSPELALVAESVANADARIRFFRIAFGIAQAEQLVGADEINTILHNLHRDGRIKVGTFPSGAWPRPVIRAVLLGLLCAEQAIPFGGTLDVEEHAGSWTITASGERLRADQALWQLLQHPDAQPALAPAGVQFAMLPALMPDLGLTCQAEILETSARITLTPA